MNKIDNCVQCGRPMNALRKMNGLREGHLPTVGDDASWAELKKDHAPGCYWWATRGVRSLPAEAWL